jgi:hypothetical protein
MRDLYAFVAERHGIAPMFSTFIAAFRETPADGELGFKRAFWSQLQRLRDVDCDYHEWDPAVSADPASSNSHLVSHLGCPDLVTPQRVDLMCKPGVGQGERSGARRSLSLRKPPPVRRNSRVFEGAACRG